KRTGRVWVPAEAARSADRLRRARSSWLCRDEIRLLDLHRRNRRVFLLTVTGAAGVAAFAAPTAQLLTTRLSVEGKSPEAVVVRRGAQSLAWMPYPFQDRLEYDTGLTSDDFLAEDRRHIEISVRRYGSADVELLGLIRPVLRPRSQLRCAAMIEDW